MVKNLSLQCRRAGFDSWVGKIPCRREWLPTPVFLPSEFHGQRILAGYSPWGHKESDMTEQLILLLFHCLPKTEINIVMDSEYQRTWSQPLRVYSRVGDTQ